MYKHTYNLFNNRYLTNGFRKLSYFSFRNYFFLVKNLCSLKKNGYICKLKKKTIKRNKYV